MSELIMAEMGSEIFKRFIQESLPEHKALNLEVWSPTPWMVDVFVGEYIPHHSRNSEIRNWLQQNFGNESSPIHKALGLWHESSVTIHGYSWYGFKTEKLMNRFLDQFHSPPNPSEHSTSYRIKCH